MNSQQGMEAIFAMDSGFDLSSIACTCCKESERDEDPCERDFFKNSFMTKLFVLGDWDFTICTIIICQKLCAPLTLPVLPFWLRRYHILLENFISFSLILSLSYIGLWLVWSCVEIFNKPYMNFCKTGYFLVLSVFGSYWTGIIN